MKSISRSIFSAVLNVATFTVSAATMYEIEVSYNDEFFIINGEKYEAKVYCFNMEAGDPVIFLDGSPLGACVSASLLNLNTRDICEVWCE